MDLFTNIHYKKYLSIYSGLSSQAWQGILVSFIEATLVGICYFLSLYLVNEIHLTIRNVGMIISCYGLGTILGGLMGGKLSDQIAPRNVSIASLLLQGAAYFLIINVKSTPLLMLNLFIIGIGSYGFITSNHVWTLAHCHHSERLKAINLLDVASNLGLAVSGMIVGYLTTNKFSMLFLMASILLGITAFYLMFSKHRKSKGINNEDNSTNNFSGLSINLTIICFVLFCLFLVGLIISQINSTYPIYLQAKFSELGTSSFSNLLALNAILVVLFQAPLVNLVRVHNKIILLGVGACILGIGILLLIVSYAYWVAILSCILITIGEILFFSISQLICYEKGPDKKKGLSLGSYRMTYAASRVLGPVAGGFFYQQFGSNLLWGICFGLSLLCLFPSLLLSKYD